MSWNYRVMKRENSSGEYDYGIYEVYYDENGKVISWTINPITPVRSSEEELQFELHLMLRAFKETTLVYEEDEDSPAEH